MINKNFDYTTEQTLKMIGDKLGLEVELKPNFYLQKYLDMTNKDLKTGKIYVEINCVNGKIKSSYSFKRIIECTDDIKIGGTD